MGTLAQVTRVLTLGTFPTSTFVSFKTVTKKKHACGLLDYTTIITLSKTRTNFAYISIYYSNRYVQVNSLCLDGWVACAQPGGHLLSKMHSSMLLKWKDT